MSDGTYTVAGLAAAVGRAVDLAFPDEVWVRGEIRDLSRARSGHVYFLLVDSDDEAGEGAVLPVTLFAGDKDAVNRRLRRSGAVRMTDGVEVRIRGRVGHYAARGLVQLRMSWIDPEYTLGRLAVERQRLLRRLRSEGLTERNRRLVIPRVPLSIGLLTSVGSAAHADFMDELTTGGFAWRVSVFDSPVQGVDAAPVLIRGIAALQAAGVDVIALIRGGGAQTDLALFDREDVARAVAGAAVPVLVGIGHETDLTVADFVARSFKTPTACARELVDTVARFAERIDELGGLIARTARARLHHLAESLRHTASRVVRSAAAASARSTAAVELARLRLSRTAPGAPVAELGRIDGIARRIGNAVSRDVVAAVATLDQVQSRFLGAVRRRLSAAEAGLDAIERRAVASDPRRLFARGWSITRRSGGSVVKQPGQVAPGDRLVTTVAGGIVASIVTEGMDSDE